MNLLDSGVNDILLLDLWLFSWLRQKILVTIGVLPMLCCEIPWKRFTQEPL